MKNLYRLSVQKPDLTHQPSCVYLALFSHNE